MVTRTLRLKSIYRNAAITLSIVFFFSSTVSAASLVHRFDFENETANDPVGGLEGQLMGSVAFSDDAPSRSRAMLLEGASFVRIEENVEFGSQFSVAMWVQPDSSALGIQNLIGNGIGGWDSDGWKLYYNTWSDPLTADGALILETGDGVDFGLAGDAVRSNTGLVIDDVWYHIGATIDVENNLVSMYLDGELLSTSGGLNIDMNTGGPFEIGHMINGWDLHGQMDDVQIYEGILSADEMSSLFESPGSAIGFNPTLGGDYNHDGTVDAADIDLQTSAMAAAGPDLSRAIPPVPYAGRHSRDAPPQIP